MVALSTISGANVDYAKAHPDNTGTIAVFAGATGGIGLGTIEALAKILPGATFYVLGRSASKFSPQEARLKTLNPTLKIVFVEAQVGSIQDIDRATKEISEKESKVDLLYMSQGCFPLNKATYTEEGLDTCFTIQYYSRIRIISNLLPLLRRAPAARVLNVLNGGREGDIPVLESDLGLLKPENYKWTAVIAQTTTFTTLALEHLAQDLANKNITFIHAFPGLVRTQIFSRLEAPEGSSFISRVFTTILTRIAYTVQYILGVTIEVCGTRQAWILTDGRFNTGGALRTNEKNEIVTGGAGEKMLERYRASGLTAKVWDFTLGQFEKATSK
ncbi:hypothetical protein B0O99DRAFT_613990 [Bisporella sp. PMI_857]|nr:hypothetical protein B0O99DRAFT_613990 [Bisporella sp. PMI_857]